MQVGGQEAAILQRPGVFLGIERIAVGTREDARPKLRGEHASLEVSGEKAPDVVVSKWADRDRGGIALAAGPARSSIQELGPRSRDDQDRHTRRPVGEVVDEVEQPVVRPLEILEDEHERPPLRDRLEQPPPRRERLARTSGGCRVGRAEPHERACGSHDPVPLRLVGHEPVNPCHELAGRCLRVVALQDPELGLDDLAERPVADALPVRQRPPLPPCNQLLVCVDDLEELGDQAALADARNADERHELGGQLGAAAFEGVREEPALSLTSDQRGSGRDVDVEAEARARCDNLPDGDREGLALCVDRRRLPVLDGRAGRTHRRLAGENAADGCRRLQPRSRVDDVARDHALALGRPRAERYQCLTGIHRGADPQLEARRRVVQLLDRAADREGSANRPLRVVLVRDRRAEDGHDRVSDELLDRASVSLDLRAKPRVVRRERRADVLRVEPLRPAREADEVGEEDGDDLPFLARGRRVRDEGGTAHAAEAEAVGVLLTARRAGLHLAYANCEAADSRSRGRRSHAARL